MYINTNKNKEKTVKFLKLLVENGFQLGSNIQLERFKARGFNPRWIRTNYSEPVSWHSDNIKVPSDQWEGCFDLENDYNTILKKLNIKQTMNYSYNVSANSVTLFVDNKPYIAKNDHPNFKKIVSYILSNQESLAVPLFNIAEAITQKTNSKLTVKNGEVYFGTTKIHNSVCARIREFLSQGKDINHLVKFLEKLLNNPSKYVFNNLYEYLTKYNLSIDKDGDIYGLKAVKFNLKSKWTDSVQYAVDETYSEPRALLRDDQNDGYCGPGLWFGHEQFVFSYGSGNDHVLVVKVNPEHVLAIPTCSGYQKMAACAITPILDLGEIESARNNFTFKTNSVYDTVYNGEKIVSKNSNKPKRNHLGQFCS